MADLAPTDASASGVATSGPTAGSSGARGTRRLYAIKGMFSGDYSGVRGAFLLLLDLEAQRLDRIHAIIANDKTEYRFQTSKDWKSFEDGLISAKLHGQVIAEMSRDVQAYVKRVIQDEVMPSLVEAIVGNAPGDVRRIMAEVVSKAVADANVLMETSIELVDLADIVDDPSVVVSTAAVTEEVAPTPEGGQPAEAPLAVQQIKIRVDPILSPVNGIAMKNITPGMTMVVEVKDAGAAQSRLAKIMAIKRAGSGDRKLFEGKVLDVAKAEYNRISITMLLAPDVIGQTNISGELRVKVSDASLQLAQVRDAGANPVVSDGQLPPVSTNIFLWAALGIFTIMLILAYLIFGGII